MRGLPPSMARLAAQRVLNDMVKYALRAYFTISFKRSERQRREQTRVMRIRRYLRKSGKMDASVVL